MNIGLKIKELRQKSQMTQGELAELIGVSVQAVSRWENNLTCPDISLLPILANIFDITVDELLDVSVYKKQEEISKILTEDLKLANIGDSEKRIQILKESLKKYPNSYKLMERLAHAMYSYSSVNDEEGVLDELIELCEKVLSKCTDDEIRYSIIQLLCYNYRNKKEFTKAKELANRMPDFYSCKDSLLEHVLIDEEKEIQIQNNTITLIEWFHGIIISSSNKEPLVNIKLWNKYLQLLSIIFDDKNYGFYYTRFSNAYKMIAHNYAKLGDVESTIEHLKLAIEFAIKYESRPSKSNYTSLMINKLVDEKDKSSKNTIKSEKHILEIELENTVYDNIKKYPEFKVIVEMLNSMN